MPRSPIPVAADEDDDILSVMSPAADGVPLKAAAETAPSTDGASGDLLATAAANVETAPTEQAAEPSVAAEPEIAAAPAARSAPVKVAAASVQAERKGGAGSFILIFLLITAIAAGLFYGIYYYISHRNGG